MRERQLQRQCLQQAYEHGYMSGKRGSDLRSCPYKADAVQQAWHEGWKKGRIDACGVTLNCSG